MESPLRGHGRCAQPLSGSGAGGLVASPPFPSSVWLDSWAPLEGKPARGVPCWCQRLGNLPTPKGYLSWDFECCGEARAVQAPS